MGNFLKIKNGKEDPIAEMHYKYLPINSKNEYISINCDKNNGKENSPVNIITEGLLNLENQTKIFKLIEQYAGKEKSYQSKLIEKNSKNIIDAEIADGESSRIDLMMYEPKENKIIAVEFKMITDSRLYTNEITKQLEKYTKFMTKNKDIIKEAYKNSEKTKIELGIIKTSELFENIDTAEVEEKPILAITGDNQYLIDKLKEDITKKVQDKAYALQLFGKVGVLHNFGGNSKKF